MNAALQSDIAIAAIIIGNIGNGEDDVAGLGVTWLFIALVEDPVLCRHPIFQSFGVTTFCSLTSNVFSQLIITNAIRRNAIIPAILIDLAPAKSYTYAELKVRCVAVFTLT